MDFPVPSGDQSAGLFDTIFQEVDEAILIADLETESGAPVIVDANHTFEEWTGYSRAGICGFTIYSLLDVSDLGAKHLIECAIAARRPADVMVQLVSRDGSLIPLHLTIRPVISGDGNTRLTIVFRRTEAGARHALEIANRQRDTALRAKSEFLARVGHELRTPLNGILGLAEILKGELLGKLGHQQYRDYAEDIHAAGTKLLWRIEELLQLKMIEDDDWTPLDQEFDPAAIAWNCIAQFKPLVRERDISLAIEIKQLPRFCADKVGFRQVVEGILGGAIAAAPKGSGVALNLNLGSMGELVFEVRFEGRASSFDDIASALDVVPSGSVYRQADTGNIIGLYLANRVAERHGGGLAVTQHSDKIVGLCATFPANRVG